MADRSTSAETNRNVPDGFSLIQGRGTHKILVPTYLVPATMLAIESEDEKKQLGVDSAEAGVRFAIDIKKSCNDCL